MTKSAAHYAHVRLILGAVFILSVLVMLGVHSGAPTMPAPGSPSVEPPSEGLLAWLPVVTAVASLLGLVSTTALAWRSDRRAARIAEVEQQRQALELEKAKAERRRVTADQTLGEVRETERRDGTR